MYNSQKVEVLVPEENITINFEVTDDKPFNKCFSCQSFRNGCSGPNLPAMTAERACEFLQMARTFIGWSYQQVTDATEKIGMAVSLATVKRTLTGKNSDPSFFTMSALSIVLLGDPSGKYPCAIPDIVSSEESDKQLSEALRDLERSHADNEEYRAIIDNIHRAYKAEMDAIREEAQKKIDYLMGTCERLRKDRDSWRAESSRKSVLIDKYLDKWVEGK